VTELLGYEFMRHALAAGVLVSVACGVVGTVVVLNRIVFISAGIAHAAYGGIGLGYFFRFNPIWGAMAFSVAAALGMGAVQRWTRERADTLIGVMWAIGMAVGVILIDRTEGYKADLMSYLFGSILTVPAADLAVLAVLDLVLVVGAWLFHKELLAISFDETFAVVQNVPVERIHMVLLCLIAVTVVMMMRVVGLILVIALLTMPAAIAAMFVHDMRRVMAAAAALGMLFTTVGLWFSYRYDLTSGATIILTAAVGYLLAQGFRAGRRALPRREPEAAS
jgi:zinc transport system permease protein